MDLNYSYPVLIELAALGSDSVENGVDSGKLSTAEIHFTRRERAVLRALARGMSNDAIADSLFVTIQTVKFHLKNLYRKLGIQSRFEAMTIIARAQVLVARESTAAQDDAVFAHDAPGTPPGLDRASSSCLAPSPTFAGAIS